MTTTERKLKMELIMLKQQGEYKKGIRAVRAFLKKYPTSTWGKLELAFFLYHVAMPKRSDQAIQIYRHVLNEDIYAMHALQFLSRAYASAKDLKAIPFAEVAYLLFSNSITENNLANVYHMLRHYEKAEYWYRVCIRHAQTKDEAAVLKINFASMYCDMKQYKKADKLFHKALREKKFVGNPVYAKLVARIKKQVGE